MSNKGCLECKFHYEPLHCSALCCHPKNKVKKISPLYGEYFEDGSCQKINFDLKCKTFEQKKGFFEKLKKLLNNN